MALESSRAGQRVTAMRFPGLFKDALALIPVTLITLSLNFCSGDSGQPALSGVLETDDLDIIAPLTGKLLSIAVEEGAGVAVGDTVAVLDTVSVAAAYRAALAAADQARALLADLEAGSDAEKIRVAEARLDLAGETLAQAARDAERAAKLNAERLIDDKTLEEANLAHQNAIASEKIAREQLADLKRGARVDQLAAARAAATRAAEELALRKKSYDDAFLVAEHKGTVQILPYQVGEYVPAGKAVVRLQAADNLWAMIYVPENRLNLISVGAEIRFQVDALPERTFMSQVVFVSSEAEFTPRNVQSPDERLNLVFQVKVAVTSDRGGLRAGMPADFYLKGLAP
ncbi:MAG: HlyD family secretion protein [Candidatus Zixiibacteriota bacterium]